MRIRVGLTIVLGLVPVLIQPARACGQYAQGQPGQGRSQPNAGQGQGEAAKDQLLQLHTTLQGTVQGLISKPNQDATILKGVRDYVRSEDNVKDVLGRTYWQNLHPQIFAFIDAGNKNSGMSLAPADEALRAHLKLPKDEGLIVTAVDAGSAAAQAGIQQNDVLLRLGGKDPKGLALGKPEDLEAGLKAAGDDPVSLMLLRRGKRIAIKVQPRVQVSLGPVQPDPPTYWIGVSVAAIEPALRSQLLLPDNHGGLLATDVVKDSPGAKAGVQAHDILLKLDSQELTDQSKLIQVVQAKGDQSIPLEIVREGKKQTIEITPLRRNKVSFSVNWSVPKTVQYDVILPGAVVQDQPRSGLFVQEALNNIHTDSVFVQGDPGKEAKPSDPATAKRLDDLSAQIKELRQAVADALAKTGSEKK
jgi:serine protease Do